MDAERLHWLMSGALLLGRLQERDLIEGGAKINMPKLVADLDQLGGPLSREQSIDSALGLMREQGHIEDGDTMLELLGMAYDGKLGARA